MFGTLSTRADIGLVVAVAIVFHASSASAELIAYWDFNDDDLIVDEGAGTLTTNFIAEDVMFFGGTSINARPGVVAGQALGLEDDSNNGHHVDFSLDTSGTTDLILSFATQGTGTGFDDNQVSYSSNAGSSFVNFGAPYAPASSFELRTFDFSSVSELDDNANTVIRMTFDGATGGNGNNRLDNVQFNATAIPEPPLFVLLGASTLAGLCFLLLRPHRRHASAS